jgi:hypothetical protein
MRKLKEHPKGWTPVQIGTDSFKKKIIQPGRINSLGRFTEYTPVENGKTKMYKPIFRESWTNDSITDIQERYNMELKKILAKSTKPFRYSANKEIVFANVKLKVEE